MFCPACTQTFPADYKMCPTDGLALLGSDRIGKYKVEGLVGVGGMGAVYRATNPDTQAVVAIKVMSPLVAGAEEARARFQREAEASARLKTNHVVQVYDFGVAPDGNMFLVMELLAGHPLRDEVMPMPEPMPLARVQMVMDGALKGLNAAHKAGIVHRDLKPENVFVATVDDTEVPKLLDFGIARVRNKSSDLTRAGAMMGTAAYMAPEQALATPDGIGPWTDVYAMGAILYELLSGEAAFAGDTLPETLSRVMTGERKPLPTLRPGLPVKIYELVDRCLDQDRTKRPQDADAMRSDLLAARLVAPGTEIPPFDSDGAPKPKVNTPPPQSTNPAVETAMLQITRDRDVVTSLLGYFETVKTAAGVVLFSEGDASDAMYLVESGTLEAVAGKRVLSKMVAGEVFGESGIYRDTKRSATVRTTAACVLLKLSAAGLTAMTRDSPRLVTELHRFVAAVLAKRMVEKTAPRNKSPLPFVLAGVVVVGGGAAVFALTRPGTSTTKPVDAGVPPQRPVDAAVALDAPSIDAAPKIDPIRSAMIHIAAGTHAIGDDQPESLKKHDVALPELWIDPAEMTLGELRAALKASVGGLPADALQLPARQITYAQADAACKALGKRLPTEIEWEAAALTTPNDPKLALSAKATDLTASKHAGDCSPAGLCDMLGGVSEWTSTTDAKGMVVRGSSYSVAPTAGWEATIHARAVQDPAKPDHEIGVRCVIDAPK